MTRFHGGVFEWENYYDFSGTGSPISPPRFVDKLLHDMISRHLYTLRPDHNYNSYRKMVSELLIPFSVDPDNIVPVGGTNDALRLTFIAFKPKVVITFEPCSGEHRELSKIFGAKYIPLTYVFEESICGVDISKFESTIMSHGDKRGMVIISNPTNPTGCAFEKKLLESLIELFPKNWILYVNEAFGDFLEHKYSALSLTDDRVIVARSFTKTLNIQGLRAGYVVLRNKKLAKKYDILRETWPITTLAAKLIEILIEEEGLSGYRAHIQRIIRTAEVERKYIDKLLSRASYRVYPSVAPFNLIEHPWIKHPQIDLKLEKYRVRIRDASTYYGLSREFSRISIKTRSRNKILVRALINVAEEENKI